MNFYFTVTHYNSRVALLLLNMLSCLLNFLLNLYRLHFQIPCRYKLDINSCNIKSIYLNATITTNPKCHQRSQVSALCRLSLLLRHSQPTQDRRYFKVGFCDTCLAIQIIFKLRLICADLQCDELFYKVPIFNSSIKRRSDRLFKVLCKILLRQAACAEKKKKTGPKSPLNSALNEQLLKKSHTKFLIIKSGGAEKLSVSLKVYCVTAYLRCGLPLNFSAHCFQLQTSEVSVPHDWLTGPGANCMCNS